MSTTKTTKTKMTTTMTVWRTNDHCPRQRQPRCWWLLTVMKVMLLWTALLPISSLAFRNSEASSSAAAFTNVKSSMTKSTMTTTTTTTTPKILCCSCDESTALFVQQTFASSTSSENSWRKGNLHHTHNNNDNIKSHTTAALNQLSVHHVATSQQALQTLLDHPEGTFSTIIIDESTWDNGSLFQACLQKRLLPVRIVVDTTVAARCAARATTAAAAAGGVFHTKSFSSNGAKDRNNNGNNKSFYEMGADVVVPMSVTALQQAHHVLVRSRMHRNQTSTLSRSRSSGTANKSNDMVKEKNHNEPHPPQLHHHRQQQQQQHPLQLRYQREAQLQELSGGRVTHRIRELKRHSERLAHGFFKFSSSSTNNQNTNYQTGSAATTKTTSASSTSWQDRHQRQSPHNYHKKSHQNHPQDDFSKADDSCSSSLLSSSSSSSSSLRIVHISDTHNFHRHLYLPPGNILLHTGDMCGNYYRSTPTNLVDQFEDFLEWIHSSNVYSQYDKIILLAGNHDTYLDPEKMSPSHDQYQRAQTLLQDVWNIETPSFSSSSSSSSSSSTSAATTTTSTMSSSKVCYLDQSSIQFRGLTIYGSPTTICRVETKNRQMRSNGFERTHVERQQSWNQIPHQVDILMTHLPPAGLVGANGADSSCQFLTEAVYHHHHVHEQQRKRNQQLRNNNIKSEDAVAPPGTTVNNSKQQRRRPPKLHAFGHVHSQFGVAREPLTGTILSNASQERLLRDDLYGGGTPLVIDLPLVGGGRNTDEEEKERFLEA